MSQLKQNMTLMKNQVLAISLKMKIVPYNHIKPEEPYVEPTVQDVQTTDDEIKEENEDFLQTAAEFHKIDMAATTQKSDFYNNLFDFMIDLPDCRSIIDDSPITKDIFIDDGLFSENDIEDDDKQIIDDILKDINYNDILMQYYYLKKTLKLRKTQQKL